MFLRSHFVFAAACLAVWLVSASAAPAQPVAWELRADGRTLAWPGKRAWPADSIRHAAQDALAALQRNGYLLARIDSHHVGASTIQLHATLGTRALIGDVQLIGVSLLDTLALQRMLRSRPGLAFDAENLEADAQAIVQAYADAGYHFVRVRIGTLELSGSVPLQVRLTFVIREGPLVPLRRVELLGAKRSGTRYASRLAGFRTGRPLRRLDLDLVRERLQEAASFTAVGQPVLALEADSTLVIQVPVEEAPPGAFDLALGYERDPAGGGALVGSGQLELRNMFGSGRTLSLALNRTPGQTSRLSVHANDPFVGGLPVSLGMQFEGLQQDSTYGKRAYGLELGYRLERRMQVFGSVAREVTRPGLTGLGIIGDQQRIPFATALFAGFGIRMRTVDNRINPRRGLAVESRVESGRKDRTTQVVRADTTQEKTRVQQARLRVSVRLFVPAARRQTLVLGGETLLLRSRTVDESDLFRFGGANSLRGYDEERFRAPFATRILAEYRYLFDEASHALVFFDLGYLDAMKTRVPFRGFYPGFGLGFQLNTEAGLISVTAAASTEAPSEVRVHLGVSLGL